jgi:hypothetical protein
MAPSSWKKPVVALGIACLGVTAVVIATRQPVSQEREEPFRPVRFQLPVDPTTEVVVKKVGEAKNALNPAELVLGVTVGQESRAYPINLLNEEHLRYKILNDTLGGRPIAATWCNACFNGIVFDRVVDGATLTLAVSGQLWKENMVMYDVQTQSLWSQLLGEAKVGTMQWKKLRQIPSIVTDWESWRRLYPESTVVVLPYHSREYRRDFYEKPERFVLGVASGRKAKAWRLDQLREAETVNDEWDGRPVLAVFSAPSFTARLFDREVSGRILTFRMVRGTLIDKETRTTWQPITGQAVAGKLLGRHLKALPAIVSYRDAWERFHTGAD